MRYQIDYASLVRQCTYAEHAIEQALEVIKTDAKERGVVIVVIDDMIIEEPTL